MRSSRRCSGARSPACPDSSATARSTHWMRWWATDHPGTRDFGWASARLDDVANIVPARLTALFVAAVAPVVGGDAKDALRVARRDGRAHPSPNSGLMRGRLRRCARSAARAAATSTKAGSKTDPCWATASRLWSRTSSARARAVRRGHRRGRRRVGRAGLRSAAIAVKGALLVAGTTSDAGKSVVTAGICRWLARQGVRVAPFKAQNMALNSAVTIDGAEIGRAQAMQAAACGIEPEAVMNPVLLKPGSDTHSQVVVLGRRDRRGRGARLPRPEAAARDDRGRVAGRPARAFRRRRLRRRRQPGRDQPARSRPGQHGLGDDRRPAGDRGRRHRSRRSLRLDVRHAGRALARRSSASWPGS